MTTKNKFFPLVQFHPLFIVFSGIAILTGAFVELLIIVTIVIIHELGHFAAANYFSWRINRIYMWVFGAIMETDEHGIRPIREECIVILAGPLQHVWIYGAGFIIHYFDILPLSIVQGIFFYNTVIFVFNLLPIWPLDGGKLLYLLLTSVKPYQKGYNQTLIFSQISCVCLGIVVLLFFFLHIQILFMIVFLFIEVWREWRKKQFVYMRFLLHRLHEPPNTSRKQMISVSPELPISNLLVQFRREKEHYIAIPQYVNTLHSNANPFHETICLQHYFYRDGFTHTVKDAYKSQFIQSPAHISIK